MATARDSWKGVQTTLFSGPISWTMMKMRLSSILTGRIHPYVNLYVYSGAKDGMRFGVLKSGAYVDGDIKVNPEKYYWLDSKSGKLSKASLPLDPPYTEDDLTADALITYGNPNLYYAIKNGGVGNYYYDSGMEVEILEVGRTGVIYDWNGVSFVRSSGKPLSFIYNWGFANIGFNDIISYDIPGYTTTFESADEYERKFSITKDGEDEPTLIIFTDTEDRITTIEVCSSAYCNPYGLYPGMPFSDFIRKVNEIGELFPETPYVSYIDDADEDYIIIYTGMDEDFYYKVEKAYYNGDETFTDDAKIARVCVINAVG